MNDYIAELTLDLDCRSTLPVVGAGQYDKGRKCLIHITANDQTYSAAGCTAVIKGMRQNKTFFSSACNIDNSGDVVLTLSESILAVPGFAYAKIVLSDATHNYSTQAFIIDVDDSLEGNVTELESFSVFNDCLNQLSALLELDISQIGLGNDYVPKTRTIAGVDLQDDISSEELSSALSVPKIVIAYDTNATLTAGQIHIDDAIDHKTLYRIMNSNSANGANTGWLICAAVNANAYTKMQIRALYSGELSYRVKNYSVTGSTWSAWIKFETEANKVISLSSSSTDAQYPSAKCVYDALATKVSAATSLAGYGITDAYTKTQVNNLIPPVPTKTSDLTNDSGYVTEDDIPDRLSDLSDDIGTVRRYAASSAPPTQATTAVYTVPCLWYYDGDVWYVYADASSSSQGVVYHTYSSVKLTDGQDVSDKENASNKVTSLSSSSTDTQYPSAKCVYDNVVGMIPVDFNPHSGLVDCRDLSLYGNESLGNYHTSITVSEGERYIINCRSSNSTYPGAFYTLNGTKVSAIFEDNATHLNSEITVPAGVDTLWLNSKSTIIPLDQWLVYQILPAADYCEENNNRIAALKSERVDESVETLRRLKNLESLYTFRWKPFDKAYYCFVNDGSKNWMHVLYDVFHSHGVPMAAAVVGANMELANDTETSPGGRTVKQTLDLIVADGGEVMVYLNANALLSTDPYDLWYDYAVKNGKHMIEAYDYKVRGLILSAQSARNSEVGQEICERFFDYSDHVGTKPQYDIRRAQFSDTSSVADVKAYIDSTVGTPGFYPIMMHRPSQEPWTTAAGMDEILTYIESKGSSAAVSTYSHVFDTFGTNGFLTLSDLPIYNGGVQ